MRYSMPISIIALSYLLSPIAGSATTPKPLESEQEQLSYSVGVLMGSRLRDRDSNLNIETLLRGLRHSYQGEPLLMTGEQINAALQASQQQAQRNQQQALQQLADKNQAAAIAFLAHNKERTGVEATASGLQYQILQAGEGEPPKTSDLVLINFRGSRLDGSEVEANPLNEPVELHLSEALLGWQEALVKMKPNSKWRLYMPAELAYGAGGVENVGPNELLIYDLELLNVISQN